MRGIVTLWLPRTTENAGAGAANVTESSSADQADAPTPTLIAERELLAAVEQAVIATDLDGIVCHWNRYAERLYGWTAAEALGRNIAELIAPRPSVEQAAEAMAQVGAGAVWSGEFPARHKDGTVFTAYVTDSPIADADGHLVGIIRVSSDTTLRASESRFRALIQHASDMVGIIDAAGHIIYETPAIESVLGYHPDELNGRSAFDLLHPDEHARIAAFIADIATRPGDSKPFDYRVRHADGSWRWLEATVTNLFDDPAVAGIVVNARDVTERRAAEQALRKAEERYRSLVEHVPAAIFSEPIGDQAGAIFMSPQIERILGYPAELWLGGHAAWTRIVHPDDRDIVSAELARTDATREPFALEHRHVAADGRVVWTRTEAALVDGSDGTAHWQGFIVDITERKRLEAELSHQAFHDALTGLPNRALLLDRAEQALARARRDRRHVALLFLDLDNFKLVNDCLGHEYGDDLLVRIAQVLRLSVREGDTVARLGGDEFIVLLDSAKDGNEADEVVARIQRSLSQPFIVAGMSLSVSGSIGVVLADASLYKPAQLLRDADIAMYRAKAAGKNRHVSFTPEMRLEVRERMQREADLRRAIEQSEFALHYQPQTDLTTGTTVGVEALVRWQRPERGLTAPDEFIPLAEETGLIVPIGRWVLREACRQARLWNACCPTGTPLVVSVNLSARQLAEPALANDIEAALMETGLPPAQLTLEITESTAMDDAEATVRTLTTLRALGVSISIDDFGTGYSSLAYLQRFPVDSLKIDRSFVRQLPSGDGALAIVTAITGLAHTLGIKVVAEGVETADQAACLRELGCDRAQGFLYAKPAHADAITNLLTGVIIASQHGDEDPTGG